jgi:hypothetical protein
VCLLTNMLTEICLYSYSYTLVSDRCYQILLQHQQHRNEAYVDYAIMSRKMAEGRMKTASVAHNEQSRWISEFKHG